MKTAGRSYWKKPFSDARRVAGSSEQEIGDLRFAEHVHAIGDEPAVIPGKRQARRRDIGVGHQAVEAEFAGERLELELFSGSKKVAESQRQVLRSSVIRRS